MLKISLFFLASALTTNLSFDGYEPTLLDSNLSFRQKRFDQLQTSRFACERLKALEARIRDSILAQEETFKKLEAALEELKSKQVDSDKSERFEVASQKMMEFQEMLRKELNAELKVCLAKQRELVRLQLEKQNQVLRMLK